VKRSLGSFGEEWAAALLARRGYRIIDRNVRYRVGEIDIVAEEGDTLAFVEVKTRRTSQFGRPEESSTRSRYARLAAAVETYLQERSAGSVAYRIDVVAIEVGRDGRIQRAEIIENAEPPA
jgi:putative endonuclease